ncbi:CMP-N-acetylneuraminate-poly-alpha-2,8-sialyltransferase-like [Branchiostoma lanceolatum]|uniref:CMP-N-acetylneuraminate-poly-alpha-2, 8-sialyltransferase-like n=1 Tax=Branchiostoma lanceolatum TaxID=7740 RepID=UPI0034539458
MFITQGLHCQMSIMMAERKACFRLMACGILVAFVVTILISLKAEQPLYQIVLRNKAWGDTGAKYNFNTSEVERIRQWVMTYFNPDTDLSIIKSQAHLGQGLEHEMKTTKKFKIGKYFYKLIPESPPLLGKHFRSCAVVGNSGILLDSGCGPQIDSADFVFRSNLAAIEGFENDVGTKSNFTTMNPSVLKHDYKGFSKNDKLKEKFINRLRLIRDQILHIPAFVSHGSDQYTQYTNMMIVKRHLPIKLSYAPRNVNAKMTALWQNSEFKPKRPSTGNNLFALAACLCDQIHMYGFYPFSEDEKGRKIKYHYYGNIGNLPKHEMPEEYRAFLTFHQRKALVLHTEPCNDDTL